MLVHQVATFVRNGWNSMPSTVRILCLSCEAKLVVKSTAMGKRVTCPKCGEKLVVSNFTARTATPLAQGSSQAEGSPERPAFEQATLDTPSSLKPFAANALRKSGGRTFGIVISAAGVSAISMAAYFGILWASDHVARDRADRDAAAVAIAAKASEEKRTAAAARAEADRKAQNAKAEAEARAKAEAEAKARTDEIKRSVLALIEKEAKLRAPLRTKALTK